MGQCAVHGRAGCHRRRRPDRPHPRHRPRPARGALHGAGAEAGASVPAQDGALQRAHHGDLPAHGHRRAHPRGRAAGALPDGRVHRALARRAAALPPALPLRRRLSRADRRLQRREPAARALPAHLPVHPRAGAQVRRRVASHRKPALRLHVRLVFPGRERGVGRDQPSESCARRISWAATVVPARCAASSASASPARRTCSNCARRSTAAKRSTSASRSARGATITWPTHSRAFSSCRTRRSISRSMPWSSATRTWRRSSRK